MLRNRPIACRRRAAVAAAIEQLEGRMLLAGNPGDLDTSFSGDGVVVERDEGFDRLGIDVAAAGGKLVTVEIEHLPDTGPVTRIVRYNSDGTRDASFGSGGSIATSHLVHSVAVRGDGKILAAGNGPGNPATSFILRLNADGSPDPSFSSDGRVDLREGMYITDLTAAPGDKVVAAVYGDAAAERRLMQAVRLDADGSADQTFSGDGYAAIDALAGSTTDDNYAVAEGVVVRPDGRVALVAGVSRNEGGNFDGGRFAVAQFTADGEPDPTFGEGDGLVITEFGGAEVLARHLALAPDGKLVAAGINLLAEPDISDLALARYNPDGSLDTTLSGGGTVLFDVGIQSAHSLDGLAVQADGRILVAGYGNFDDHRLEREFYAARLTTSGAFDPDWDDDGRAYTDFFGEDDSTQAAILDSSGRLLVIGETFAEGMRNRGVVRYTTSGELDATFSGDGRIADDFPQILREAHAAVVQPDGKIIVAGSWRGAGKPNKFFRDFYLTRYNADGSRDTGFGEDGRVWTDFGGRIDSASELLLLPDGKIVAVGSSVAPNNQPHLSDLAVARYHANGSLDTSFSGDGKLTRDLGGRDAGLSVARRSDGDLIVAASAEPLVPSELQWALVRFNADGSIDDFLDGDGVLHHAYGEYMALQPDDKIVLARFETGDFATPFDSGPVVTRLNTNGSPDPTFDGDGSTPPLNLNPGGHDEPHLDPKHLLVSGDKILLLAVEIIDDGAGEQGLAVVRYNRDGSLDDTFGGGDGRATDLPFAFARAETPQTMAIDGKGRIVVTGHSDRGEENGLFIMRLTPDGARDTSFGDADGRGYSDTLDGVRDIAIGPDHHPVVTGGGHTAGRFLGEPASDPGDPGDPAAPEVTVTLESNGSALADGQSAAVEFGTWAQGQSGATRRFIVRNDGNAPLQLGAATMPAGFTTTEPLANTLAPGESDGFTVTLDTSAVGERAGVINIPTSDADENPFNFSVSGAVVPPGSQPDPADITVLLDGTALAAGQTIDFGTAPAGVAAPERTITIRNDGAADLALGSVATPTGYTVSGPSLTALAPGESTTVRIALSTAAAGTFAGAATVASSDIDENSFTLNLTGVVTPGVPAEPSPLEVSDVTGKVPSVLIAGERRARGSVAFTVTNTTAAAFAGPMTFAAWASPDVQQDASDVQLASATRKVKLKAGASRTMRLKFRFPQGMPAGDQHMLVTATAVGPASSDTAAGPQVSVRAPFVRLAGLPASAPAAKPLTFGKRAKFTVPLENAGNVRTSRAPATYTLVVSSDGTDAGQVFQTTATGRINLKPDASRPQKVKVAFPPGAFPAGSYSLIVRLSVELNQTNGDTVALIPFTIA